MSTERSWEQLLFTKRPCQKMFSIFQYFSHKCSKSIKYIYIYFLVNGIYCSVLIHLKNMFYMSNERSWLQPLFTKWTCQIMISIIRNNIWERIRCQTLRLSEVESSLEYFEGVIKWIADRSPQSLLCHRPMENLSFICLTVKFATNNKN